MGRDQIASGYPIHGFQVEKLVEPGWAVEKGSDRTKFLHEDKIFKMPTNTRFQGACHFSECSQYGTKSRNGYNW
jgi:hypothetical protein